MTLLLVMLHAGTMCAVIFYFWQQWRRTYFQSGKAFKKFAGLVIIATVPTGVIGETLIKIIEHAVFRDVPHSQIEDLFRHLELIAPALAAGGVLILIAGIVERRKPAGNLADTGDLNSRQAALIGAVQGLCLPFRGFSRSGATISAGMLAGVAKSTAETFSFALAVVLTPPIIAREVRRLIDAEHISGTRNLASAMMPSLLGAICAFVAGLVALKWLSQWLEGGRWYLFGLYCLVAAAVVTALHHMGY